MSAEEVARRRDQWRRAHGAMGERERAQPDPTGLIAIEEADRLKMTGLEQERDLFDQGGLGGVLVGVPGLERRSTRTALLFSRMGCVHEFRPLAPAEVRWVRGGWRRRVWCCRRTCWPTPGVRSSDPGDGWELRLVGRLAWQVGRILESDGLGEVRSGAVEAGGEVVMGAGRG